MPFTKKQQTVAQIAEHHPEKLYKKNRGFLSMSKEELHKFATEPIKKKEKK